MPVRLLELCDDLKQLRLSAQQVLATNAPDSPEAQVATALLRYIAPDRLSVIQLVVLGMEEPVTPSEPWKFDPIDSLSITQRTEQELDLAFSEPTAGLFRLARSIETERLSAAFGDTPEI